MPTPTFSPPIAPSFEYSETPELITDRLEFGGGYEQVHARSIRPLRRVNLSWNVLTDAQRQAIEAFFFELNGKPGPFYWTPHDITPAPLAAPSLAEVAGGSIAATTYYATFTWYNATHGETTQSAEASLAVSSSHFLTVTVPAIPNGVGGWRVYVSTSSGATVLEDTITTGARTWTQSAALSGSGSAPSTNTLNPPIKWHLASPIEKSRYAAGRWRMRMTLRETFI